MFRRLLFATCLIVLLTTAVHAQALSPDTLVLKTPIATTQPIGPDFAAEEVIRGFLDSFATTQYDPFVAQSQSKMPPDQLAQGFQNTLAVRSPRMKEALDLIDNEQPAKAAEVLAELAHCDDPYLAVAAASLAAGALIELERIEPAHALLKSALEKHFPITRYTLAPDHFEFMLGYCQVHNLEYDAAQATLVDFLRRYPHAPERLRVTAAQIVTELSRRIPNRLGDVHDLMNAARRQLSHGASDESVIQRQTQAVALLDDLIKEAEDQEKSDDNSNNQGNSKPKPNSPNQPSGGAKQSILPGGGEKETVLRQSRASPGETWGRMPPKEREEILQAMQKQFPSRYRELLEQYYKQLAKDQPAP